MTGYAASAPDADIRMKAVFRVAWLDFNQRARRGGSGFFIRAGGIPDDVEKHVGVETLLGLSGAMGLLASWHRPRATVID